MARRNGGTGDTSRKGGKKISRGLGNHGCPFCTSDKIKVNLNGLVDGTKFICENCKRKFDNPIKRGKKTNNVYR